MVTVGGASDACEAERCDRVDGRQEDATLVAWAVDGDERAWELIVARHGTYLRGIGRACGLTGDECSDAVQETWLSAVGHLADLRDHRLLRPWLAAIMRRTCQRMSQRRRNDRECLVADMTELVGVALRDEHVDVEREVLTAERASILRSEMRRLPERDRVLLYQLFSGDLGYDEVARRLQMPVGSIGPTRMRVLRRMRVWLDQTPAGDLLRAA